jgi:hypothetical protein
LFFSVSQTLDHDVDESAVMAVDDGNVQFKWRR